MHRLDPGHVHRMTGISVRQHFAGDNSVVVARAQGDFLVHLTSPGRRYALCGRTLRTRVPHKSFREAGCRDCLSVAISDGQIAARETDQAWINLLRV